MNEANEESSQNPSEEQSTNNEHSEEQSFKLLVNRKTNELRLQDTSGKELLLKAILVGEDEDKDEIEDEFEDNTEEPLSSDEFRKAIEKIDELGLTWTADSPPLIKPKNEESEVNLGNEEFLQIQTAHPNLPSEIGFVIGYALTGNKTYANLVGGLENLASKAEIFKQKVVTPEFRSEFFFKHAIKVPYLHDIDWEVVLKLSENNVEGMPAVAYGLLSLTLREPYSNSFASNHRHLTVAVNEKSLDRFIEIFTKIKSRLNISLELTKSMTDVMEEENKENDKSTKRLE